MDELIYWQKRLYEAGLSPAATGNISKISENNILISASGSAAVDFSVEDIVKIDFNGNKIEGIKNPSSEKLMHIEIYKKRPDIKAIIHSHSPEITSFAVCGKEINEPLIPELPVYFGKIPIADYSMPSSEKLAHEVSDLFQDYNAVLMKNHGIVIGANSLKAAFCYLETIQMYAKIYLYAKILGNPSPLSEEQLLELKQIKR